MSMSCTAFLYNTDPLWDGEQCEVEYCMQQWKISSMVHCVELPNPTTDNIEVHICSLERTYQDTVISLLNIHVQ